MAVTYFPSIAPSSRSYSPGTYPQTDFESLDGTKTTLRYGNRRVNATLNLGFSNISDADVVSILAAYKDSNENWTATESSWIEFIENNVRNKVVTAGVTDVNLQNQYIEETQLKWRFSGPPSVTTTFIGKNNVNCSFVACLDAPI